MNKILLTFILFIFSLGLNAQSSKNDSIVQFYGIVMVQDSFTTLPFTKLTINSDNRGTYTNQQGVFSLVVKKGDEVSFSYPGFLTSVVRIPKDLVGKELSIVKVMSLDTVYLPAVVVKTKITPQEFERDFLNMEIAETTTSIAQRNMQISAEMINALTPSGREAVSRYLQQNSNSYYTKGQMPGISVLNPAAWANFIKSLKSGTLKKKKSKY